MCLFSFRLATRCRFTSSDGALSARVRPRRLQFTFRTRSTDIDIALRRAPHLATASLNFITCFARILQLSFRFTESASAAGTDRKCLSAGAAPVRIDGRNNKRNAAAELRLLSRFATRVLSSPADYKPLASSPKRALRRKVKRSHSLPGGTDDCRFSPFRRSDERRKSAIKIKMNEFKSCFLSLAPRRSFNLKT